MTSHRLPRCPSNIALVQDLFSQSSSFLVAQHQPDVVVVLVHGIPTTTTTTISSCVAARRQQPKRVSPSHRYLRTPWILYDCSALDTLGLARFLSYSPSDPSRPSTVLSKSGLIFSAVLGTTWFAVRGFVILPNNGVDSLSSPPGSGYAPMLRAHRIPSCPEPRNRPTIHP